MKVNELYMKQGIAPMVEPKAKEAVMEKLLKSHLAIAIAILVFSFGILGFFFTNFYLDTKAMRGELSAYVLSSTERLSAIQGELTSIKTDIDWLKDKTR